MKSAAAIAFDYSSSRLLAGGVLLVLLLALLAIALSGLDLPLKLVVAGATLAYAAIALRRFLHNTVRRVAWHSAGHWRVVDAHGEQHTAELRRAVVRVDWITLDLRRSDGARIALVLAPDNSDAETRRRLRVRLARGIDAPAV